MENGGAEDAPWGDGPSLKKYVQLYVSIDLAGFFLSLSTPWYSASDPTRPFSAGATTVV